MITISKVCTLLGSALLLSGCYAQSQYSSGADYLAAQPTSVSAPANQANMMSVDERVALAANVEPNLRFPGHFGLARLVNGQLTAIPEAEAALWMEVVDRHPDFGTFTPISPLVAHLAASHVGLSQSGNRKSRAIESVRIGAARQHVDTVLIYEAGARSDKGNTLLAIADLTIIGGAFLPTRHIETAGKASAILVDVRNGYPYGHASAVVDLSRFHSSWGSDRKTRDMEREAILEVVGDLVIEVEDMLLDLRTKAKAHT